MLQCTHFVRKETSINSKKILTCDKKNFFSWCHEVVYIIMFLKSLSYRNFFNIAKLTMVMVYSCLREFIVFRRITISPPPSTVSMVRARRLGVKASKSLKINYNISQNKMVYAFLIQSHWNSSKYNNIFFL